MRTEPQKPIVALATSFDRRFHHVHGAGRPGTLRSTGRKRSASPTSGRLRGKTGLGSRVMTAFGMLLARISIGLILIAVPGSFVYLIWYAVHGHALWLLVPFNVVLSFAVSAFIQSRKRRTGEHERRDGV